jgi:flagellar biosynthesis/type III secretory pathway protein FliH
MHPELSVRVLAAPRGVRVVANSEAEYLGTRMRSEFERGVQEGRRRAVEDAASALNRAAEKLEQACAKLVPDLASSAVDLAVEIARSIVRAEVAQNHHDIEKIVRETLATSGVGRGACVVHVHPLDAERLKSVPFRSGTKLEADPEVPAGDVHITTPHGVLVRDQDEVLAAIRTRIHGEMGT